MGGLEGSGLWFAKYFTDGRKKNARVDHHLGVAFAVDELVIGGHGDLSHDRPEEKNEMA